MSNSKDINKKSSPNQMRVFMQRIREGKYTPAEQQGDKKEMTMRDMLKITRRLNEDVEEPEAESPSKKTVFDPKHDKERFENIMKGLNSSVEFHEFKVTEDKILFGGTQTYNSLILQHENQSPNQKSKHCYRLCRC